jgi:hypothetical protein
MQCACTILACQALQYFYTYLINGRIFGGKNNKYYLFSVCVCSLRYPACNAHAPYWPVRLYNIFPYYLINCTIFGEKTISITYSKCVSVALGTQHAMRMRHIVICRLCGCTVFFPHYLINGTKIKKKLLNTKCVF